MDAVRHEVVELAGEVHRAAVAQVPALAEVHPHDGVADVEHGGVDGIVRRRAAVRLHVGVLGAEERLRAIDAQRLDPVDDLGAAVVELARVALGILVVEQRTEGLEDSRTGDVLRGNQLQRVLLALVFVADRGTDLGIDHVDPAGQIGAGLQHPAHYPRISSDDGIAPWRRMRGVAPVRSRMVEGWPIRQGPPSSTRSSSSPNPAMTWSASTGGGCPAGLALLLAMGSPSAVSSASATSWSGARTAMVEPSVGMRAGSTRVSGPGQKRSINP